MVEHTFLSLKLMPPILPFVPEASCTIENPIPNHKFPLFFPFISQAVCGYLRYLKLKT